MLLTRRRFQLASTLFAVAGGGFAAQLLPSVTQPARADDTVSATDLAEAGPNGDFWQGSDNAPVTVIEYASMTCPHCAHFTATTLPELQKRYIDTGKVRYTLRTFPFDALAAAGFMLAICGGKDKYQAITDTLFAKQADWVVQEPIAPLMSIAKQFGFTQQSFDDCLSNQKIVEGIEEVRNRAISKFGVNSTPTFFINGKKLVGDHPIDDFAKEIDPYLKEG